MIIDTENIEQARKLIKASVKPIIIKAKDDVFNRKMLEYGRFDILLSVESGKRSDSLRQLDSGLNHVLAKIAKKNNISIGIDIGELKNLDMKEKGKRLARIRNNIEICRKAETKIIALNSKNKIAAFYFFISLGASTQQAKQAISF